MDAFRGLRLYNTLTRSKEDFVPIDPGNVRLYVCGPTVYDHAHIGNARPVIVFDVLFRLLRHLYGEDHVTYVRNITDVDDKINARALRDYPDLPLNEAIRRVTEKTAGQFHKDVAALGCLTPTFEPRATEFVLPRADGKTDMASLIQTLIERGKAYVAEGESGVEVLFDTAAMPDYGALSRRRLEDQQAGARVAVEAHKKNPADFVLWKESGADEPGWEAEFAGRTVRGRPGWHIECSAMSDALLWEDIKDQLSAGARERPHQFDIHGGGLDLIFPHHENEIAQSRCAFGTEMMANVWMHNGYLEVEGRKMAKSEGNFVTIRDLLETNSFGGLKWPGEVLRFAMLMTHYRQPIDFSQRALELADLALRSFAVVAHAADGEAVSPEFVGPLLDDLNTPSAIAELHGLQRRAQDRQRTMIGKMSSPDANLFDLDFLPARQLTAGLAMIGIDIFAYDPGWVEKQTNARISDGQISEIEPLIAARAAARAAKDWAEADRIRDELAEMGISLRDAKNPVTGEMETTWEVRR